MAKNDAREAARARAAADREAATRRRSRARLLGIGGAVLAVLVAAGITLALVLGGGSGSTAAVRAGGPPWPAPSDTVAKVQAAGLSMLTAEGQALHIHQHLSVTVDGKPVRVPALIGIQVEDGKEVALSAIHTHDTTGIIHVESPEVKEFTLGQVFTEWGVPLAPGRVGPYRNGRDGTKVALFVNRAAYTADPTRLLLASRQDIDLVVTTDGSTPEAPTKPFAFPKGY